MIGVSHVASFPSRYKLIKDNFKKGKWSEDEARRLLPLHTRPHPRKRGSTLRPCDSRAI